MIEDEIELGIGRHLRLLERDGWEFVARTAGHGVVAVVALTADHRLILVEQHRPPLGGPVIELPAGLMGDEPGEEGESPLAAAQRELLEETGFAAEIWTDPGIELPSSAGLSNETVHVLIAQNVRRVGTHERPVGGKDEESIVVHEVPLAVLTTWLAKAAGKGRPADGRVWAAAAIVNHVLGQ